MHMCVRACVCARAIGYVTVGAEKLLGHVRNREGEIYHICFAFRSGLASLAVI